MKLAGLPIDQLATRCAEETEKYNRRQDSEGAYCFELFRRALAEGDDECFTRIYRTYERLMLSWVHRNQRFDETGETAAFFVNSAFSQFNFAVRGAKFERFPSVQSLLMYLKLCVHTGIAQYLRDQRKIRPDSIDIDGQELEIGDPEQEKKLGVEIEQLEMWARIRQLLPNPRDLLLARCVFSLEMRPSEIMAKMPGRWKAEREISVALYRIRQLLREDAELRQLSGLASAAADETANV